MKISVVIPAYNEEKFIKSTLESIQNQTIKPYEIVVVDNGSCDKTKDLCEQFGVRVISEATKGPGFARRTGFEAALGEIIATTDADTLVPPDWIYNISKAFSSNPNVIAVGGPYQLDSKKHLILEGLVSRIWIFGDKILNRGNNIPGVNMAILKTAYMKTGGFKKAYFEDLDLSIGLKKQGKVVFLKGLIVTTSSRRYDSKGYFKSVLGYTKNYLRLVFKGSNIDMDDIR